jgi:hypothetical protein
LGEFWNILGRLPQKVSRSRWCVASRVTRLCEISHNELIVYFVDAFTTTKNWLGYILGYFLQTHPVTLVCGEHDRNKLWNVAFEE